MKRYLVLFFLIIFVFSFNLLWAGELSVQVNPRIEALSILNYIAGIKNWPCDEEFLKYKKDIDSYFIASHKRKHPAIDMIQILKTFGFKDEAPYLLLLHLSPDFKFLYPKKSFIQISKGIDIPTGSLKEALLKKFIFEFKAFYYDYKFQEFFKKHKTFYKTIEKNVRDLMPIDLISVLEDFFKAASLDYSVFITPSSPDNYGLYIKTPYGFESFAIMKYPYTPKIEREKLKYVYSIVKEIVRSFVEPIDYGYIEEIKKMKRLVSYNMVDKKQSTYRVINEIIVGAVASHLMKVLYSDKEEAWAIVEEEKRGYYLVRPLAKFLERYYKNLDNYRNFAEFYPELLSYLSDIDKGKTKVRIPENMGKLLKRYGKKSAVLLIKGDMFSSSVNNFLKFEVEKFKKRGYNAKILSKREYIDNLKNYKKALPIFYFSSDEVVEFARNFVPMIEINRFAISLLGFSYNGEFTFIGKVPNFFTKKGESILIAFNNEKTLEDVDIFNYLAFNYIILNKDLEIIQSGFQKFRIK